MKFKSLHFLVLFLTLFSLSECLRNPRKVSPTTCSGPMCPKKFRSGDLIFEDNFKTLNFATWQHENTLAGGGNWEFQWYTNNRTNSFVKDGVLHIRPTLTSDQYGEDGLYSKTIDLSTGQGPDQCTNSNYWGCTRTGSKTHILNPIKSARVRTLNSFNFKYGKVEVKAKLPSGDWLWPAIWMLPARNEYGTHPASGEIDIMEARGNEKIMVNGKNIGSDQIGSTLHWGPDFAHNAYERTAFTRNTPDGVGYDKAFHRFQVEWTANHIKFSVDDNHIGTVQPNTSFWKFGDFEKSGLSNPWKYGTDMAPFDREFYIILNLAVGGTNGYFPDNTENDQKKPWKNNSPAAFTDFWNGKEDWLPTWKMNENDGESSSLLVDYVKVWAL